MMAGQAQGGTVRSMAGSCSPGNTSIGVLRYTKIEPQIRRGHMTGLNKRLLPHVARARDTGKTH
jgi:hypothetical protein